MKTIKQWLKTLPSPYDEMAIANTYPTILKDKEPYKSLSIALSTAFVWRSTHEDEGYDFWKAVYLDALYHETKK